VTSIIRDHLLSSCLAYVVFCEILYMQVFLCFRIIFFCVVLCSFFSVAVDSVYFFSLQMNEEKKGEKFNVNLQIW
jgi:hypothetical protein